MEKPGMFSHFFLSLSLFRCFIIIIFLSLLLTFFVHSFWACYGHAFSKLNKKYSICTQHILCGIWSMLIYIMHTHTYTTLSSGFPLIFHLWTHSRMEPAQEKKEFCNWINSESVTSRLLCSLSLSLSMYVCVCLCAISNVCFLHFIWFYSKWKETSAL